LSVDDWWLDDRVEVVVRGVSCGLAKLKTNQVSSVWGMDLVSTLSLHLSIYTWSPLTTSPKPMPWVGADESQNEPVPASVTRTGSELWWVGSNGHMMDMMVGGVQV
jgi:hypothetical protein